MIIYLIMRPTIDLHSGASIQQSRYEVEQWTQELSDELGVDSESGHMVATRVQDAGLFKTLRDSVFSGSGLTPSMANRATYPLSGWHVFLSRTTDTPGMYPSEHHFFESLGMMFFSVDDHKRVRYASVHPSAGTQEMRNDDPYGLASHILFNLFGYENRFYRLLPGETAGMQGGGDTRLVFEKIARAMPGPVMLEISMSGVQNNNELLFRFLEFRTRYYDSETFALPGSNQKFEVFNPVVVRYAANLLVIFVILFIGIRQIFRGRVEWKRGLTLAPAADDHVAALP
ncbi:MAG: hypothetical protein ACNA8K_04335 [Cyclonatronaceae bacterium]